MRVMFLPGKAPKVADFLGPNLWTRKCLAEDERGNPVSPDSAAAVKWSLAGAIMKCYGHTDEAAEALGRVFDIRSRCGYPARFIPVIDPPTFQEVLLLAHAAQI